MNEQEFKTEIIRASVIFAGDVEADYRAGYQRGLRRGFYGSAFGTRNEHRLWLSLADEVPADTSRINRGRGYRDGLRRMIGDASFAAMINGMVRSERKATTSRANGALGGRPKKEKP